MRARVATAAVGIPILVLAVWLGGWFLKALVGLAAAAAAVELYNIGRAWSARSDSRRYVVWTVTPAGAALILGALLYVTLRLRELDHGREWMLLLVAATFAADTAALLGGKIIGSRPLAPRISPNKTWEGAAAGVAGAMAAAVAAFYLLDIPRAPWEPYALGAVLGVTGQAGDLLMSRLKRLGGVDDSGWIIPGHGGILDRLDSIVPNLFVVYYFAL